MPIVQNQLFCRDGASFCRRYFSRRPLVKTSRRPTPKRDSKPHPHAHGQGQQGNRRRTPKPNEPATVAGSEANPPRERNRYAQHERSVFGSPPVIRSTSPCSYNFNQIPRPAMYAHVYTGFKFVLIFFASIVQIPCLQ